MIRTDIVILGGGLSGAAAAVGLAGAGRQVVVIDAPRSHPVIEGVSERAAAGLRHAGLDRAHGTIGPWVPRTSHWNGEGRVANGERQVDRVRLDAALREDAAAAGARVRSGRVDRVDGRDGRWRVTTRGDETIDAAFLVEARGRRAPSGADGRRHGPASTALTRRWRLRDGVSAQTAVAAFPDGWAWFAALGDGHADLQIVVAGERLPGKAGLASFYAAQVGAVEEAAEWCDGGAPVGPVIARNANATRAVAPVAARGIRIGDAAHALDPLSGHGQFEAIGTTLNAVAVVNTLCDRPDDAAIAARFYDERVSRAFLTRARSGRDFYRLERRWAERPYWRERAAWPDDLPSHPPPRARPPEIACRPVIVDGYVSERDVVLTADHPRGVWQIDGVALVPLMRFLDVGWRPGGELAEAAARHFNRSTRQVGTALAWLDGRGLLAARRPKQQHAP